MSSSAFPTHTSRIFSRLLPELNKESERGQVLVVCSYLDELLRRVLLAFFQIGPTSDRLVTGFNAPLGTLSTRVKAAYALGLISEREFKECETLRRIRNHFAHEIHMSFADQSIRSLCDNLTMAARPTNNARHLYATAATSLLLKLNNRPHYVAQTRRGPQQWPY